MADFSISGQRAHSDFQIDIPSATSDYHLVQATASLNNWGLTGLVLGVQGTQTWNQADVVAQAGVQFYRVYSRDVLQPLDSDEDGIDDVYELRHPHLLNPLDSTDAAGDFDADGLSNRDEYDGRTDPEKEDTDGDGLTDGEEIHAHVTDPLRADTDTDGLPDGWEVAHGFDPLSDGGLVYGLVAHWTFDEGAGSVASNRVSTNWPGVLRNMEASNWTAGRNGGALWFDGLNDVVAVGQPNGVAVVTGAPFTVAAVVWQDAAWTGNYPTAVSDASYSGGFWPGFTLRYQRSANAWMGILGGSNAPLAQLVLTNWAPAQAGRWVEVALAHDGTVARLFVDGRLAAAETVAFAGAFQDELWIGGGQVNVPESRWRGAIDDVRIYRQALGTNELAAVNGWLDDSDGDGLGNGREWELGTDPIDADTDDDGLKDGEEVDVHGSDPLSADGDADLMPDAWEVANGLDPALDDAAGDADGDELTNLEEYGHGTNPRNADPDGDGLNDYAEVMTYGTGPFDADCDDDGLNDYAEAVTFGTDPWSADTEGDGLPDKWEVDHSLDPLVGTGADGASGDPDRDGLLNLQEFAWGTHPRIADTDADGMLDGWEALNGLNPLASDAAEDPDGDGLTNLQELGTGTDPLDMDTDGDGMTDGWEAIHGLNPLRSNANDDKDGDGLSNLLEMNAGTDPQDSDTDRDNLTDLGELNLFFTDPLNADTDSDGLPDGWEQANGFSPLSDGGLGYGLVAHWTFDEGAGSVASNRVSTNWPGVLRDGTASNWTAGRNGGALGFDGTNDVVAVGQTNGLAVVTGAPFTVAAVVWQEAAWTGNYPTVVSDGRYAGGYWPGFTLRYQPGANAMTLNVGGTNSLSQVSATNWAPAQAGRWVDVAFAHDGTTARLFVDGRLAAAASSAFSAALQPELWIGGGHVNLNESWWRGAIDDVRIYRQALGTNELAAANGWLGDPDGDGLVNGREWERGTDPNDADTDGDGLTDGEEADVHGSDPLAADGDADLMPDAWEVANGLDPALDDADGDEDADGLTNLEEYGHGTNPRNADPDGDGLNDSAEVVTHGTDPFDADSDDDGLDDYAEAATIGTDPLSADTDADGLPDKWEVDHSLDPLVGTGLDGASGDPDGDTLTNQDERGLGTHPNLPDTDGDGMPDGWEDDHGLNPLASDAAADADSDGLTNLQEHAAGTDPQDADTDNDGMPDGWEVAHGTDPLTDDAAGDPDGDGLTNLEERGLGTHPNQSDTDADGMPDGWEAANGLNPLVDDAGGDADGDGLTNAAEYAAETNPQQADTDTDSMPDGWEAEHGLDPLDYDGLDDPDGDGLINAQEYMQGTDPQDPDTDGDGLSDTDELWSYGTDPLIVDTDSDGLPDGWEQANGFSPLSDGGLGYGLVAHWTFDEGAGSVASNRVSTNWPGVLRNMAASNWTAGRNGGALGFDGLNDVVAVGQSNGSAVVTGAPFTVAAVVWQDAAWTGNYPTAVSDASYSGGFWPGFTLRYQRSANALAGILGSSNAPLAQLFRTNWAPAQAGRWVDVALSHDGTTARLFVDGRLAAAASGGFEAAFRDDLLIGGGHVNLNESWWRGAIDDVRIYRQALGTNELAAANDWLGDPDGDGLVNGREWERGTDPNDADTDGDGLADGEEADVHGSDPLSADGDADLMPDEWEAANGLDPALDDAAGDADGDGLTNLEEYGHGTKPRNADPDGDGLNDYAEVVTHGTDPFDADSDDDGLNDYAEAMTFGTDPQDADTDADGLPDGWEIAHGTDPLTDDAAGDPDGDGLSNLEERGLGTHPNLPDTDADGMPDGWEDDHGLNPLVNDAAADADNDGLTNLQEHAMGTDPQDADTDNDGMPDGWEIANGFDPLLDDADGDEDSDGLTNGEEHGAGTDPRKDDSDDDGLTDSEELGSYGTDPLAADTDSDGLPDGWEQTNGFSPLSDGGLGYGLVAHWTFGEGAGSVASNRVSTNWPGVLRNGTASNWTAGRNGGALWFDGTNDVVAVGQTNGLAVVTGAPFTVAAVVWQEAAWTGNYPTVLSDASYSGGFWPGFTLRYQRSANALAGILGSSNAPLAQLFRTNWAPTQAGRWVDVALAHDGTTARLFVDGRLAAAASGGFEAAFRDELLIGGGHVNVSESRWRGAIDDVRIYRQALGTNELAAVNDWLGDPDGDRLVNGREWELGTDPNMADLDVDSDGLWDVWEYLHFSDLDETADGDGDGDGLANGPEQENGTDPEDADADDDGLSDGDEVHVHFTHPLEPDTDGDGLEDGAEVVQHGTDPLSPDSDSDDLPDAWELDSGLDPVDGTDDQGSAGDPDDDGSSNLQEYLNGTDPLSPDTDGDGLNDAAETAAGTNPLVADTDSDGLPDKWEVDHEFDPLSDGGRSHGLVAHWTFDGGAATFATNRISTNWPGLLRNMAASNWTAGRNGGALWFDGLDDVVAVDQSGGAVVKGAPFTVTAVIRQDGSWTGNYPTVASDGTYAGGYWPGFTLRYVQAANALVLNIGGSNAPMAQLFATNWVPARADRWVDVALSHDGTVARLYVDGRLAEAAARPFSAGMQPELRIGGGHVNGAEAGWRGQVDDLRIYRSALAASALATVNEWIGDADGDGLSNGREWELGTDPREVDTDGDGLTDGAEVDAHGTNPLAADSDSDGMPDDWEIANGTNALLDDAADDDDGDGLTHLQEHDYGTNPTNGDPDGDGLNDYAEVVTHGTDPFDADSDDDGLNDFAEAVTFGTDPLSADTDGDGLPDKWEVDHGTDPLADDAAGDPDGDGLTNLEERGLGTHPNLPDTDADGLPDGWEDDHGLNPLVNDAAADGDGDGLGNLQEYGADTDPQNADTDGDGMPDGWEIAHGFDPLLDDADGDADADGLTNLEEHGVGTDPRKEDSDDDGMTDSEELGSYGTDPLAADTDSDGLPDGWEQANGFSPLSDGGLGYGLVAHWTFDEGAGSVASNRVSTNWPGVLRNGTASNWTAGRNGGALGFDGTNDVVAVGQTNGLAVVTGAPFTVAAVVWQEAAWTGNYPTVVSDGRYAGGYWPGFTLRYQPGANAMTLNVGGTNSLSQVSATNWAPAQAGRWVDVAFAHDGTTARLFVDGRLAAAASSAFSAALQPELWIGGGHVNLNESWWRGAIDDVRIYRQALGTNELAAANGWLGDPDGDGLVNGREWERGTDPNDADTDGDGLTDGEEADVHGSDPLSTDGDADLMPDAWEVANGLDPALDDADGDEDADGLTNLEEYGHGTNPRNADPDGDGLNDSAEVVTHGTDPFDADSDDDGLDDYAEAVTIGTDPLSADTDADGLPDKWEVEVGLDPLVGTGLDGAFGDPDGDTLTNQEEYLLGTHPLLADTDGDGLNDAEDLVHGTDPLDPDSDADGLPDGWEVDHAFTPLSGMASNLQLRCWLRFDEGAGTALVNSASADYPAQIRGVADTQWTNDAKGRGALWLAGSNGYVSVPQAQGAVVTGSSFTVCAWVWQEPGASPYPTLISDGTWLGGALWPGFTVRVAEGPDKVMGLVGSADRPSAEVAADLWSPRWAGRWAHVALVQEQATTRLYVDGSLWSERSNPFVPATNAELRIGRGHVNEPDSGWRGRIDDVRIYGIALSPAQLGELFEAQGDANADGDSNLEEFLADEDPRADAGVAGSEGALDLLFVPRDWTPEDPPQYLATFGDLNPGNDIHVLLENDVLKFILMDADGNRHAIFHPGLVGGGFLLSNATNRITASWRGFNTDRPTAEMRLFVNGIDHQADMGLVHNPRLTTSSWEYETDYWNAAFVTAPWSGVVRSNAVRFGSLAGGVCSAKVDWVATHVRPTAYGMAATNPVAPFERRDKEPPAPGARPRTLVQEIARPMSVGDFVSSNAMRVLIRRYAQVGDAAEKTMSWMGWAQSAPKTWDIIEANVRDAIAIGNQEGLDIALSSANHLEPKICYHHSNSIPHWAERFAATTNGTEIRVFLTNATWEINDSFEVRKFDVADRATVDIFLSKWREDLSVFSDYAYFFFNEPSLNGWADGSYLGSPTASTNGLAWFQEYVVAKYGPAHAGIRFPASPLGYGAAESTNAAAYRLVLDDSITNRVEITTDPDHWAKWWEWRQVVLANLLAGYADHLAELNATNAHWRGTVAFISPQLAWKPWSAINLPLLSDIPTLDWMVMENSRRYTYGTTAQRVEEDVRLQLEGLKAVMSTNTGFGSYAMAHTYPFPAVSNGITNATYNLDWLAQDMAYAAAPEFRSGLVVPYSAFLLVDRPGFTSTYQNAHYEPDVADTWSRERFSKLWAPVEGHVAVGDTATNPSVRFSWSSLEQARAYEWQFSAEPDFSATNQFLAAATTQIHWSMLSQPMPAAGQPLHWRVRGIFHVYAFDEAGRIVGTNRYPGAWAAAPEAVVLADVDLDGLPDAWERHVFGHLNAAAAGDPDGDGLTNLQEYGHGANPLRADSDGDGLGDHAEVMLYGTHPAIADTDGDGLNDHAEAVTYGTAPLDPDSDGDGLDDYAEIVAHGTNPWDVDTDGDGLSDKWEIDMGLNPLSNDAGEDLDDDGLTNALELEYGTDPHNPDSDNDGLSDGAEVALYGTDPAKADTDGDGLDDETELTQTSTDPLDPDSDGDGMLDGWEVRFGLDPHGDDSTADADADGLANLQEHDLGSDPRQMDSDSDGLPDSWEWEHGLDLTSDGGREHGLAARWTFDEGAGGSASNSASSNWHGTLRFMVESNWISGRGGRALWFDGINDVVEIDQATAGAVVTGGPFTVTATIWQDESWTGSYPTVVSDARLVLGDRVSGYVLRYHVDQNRMVGIVGDTNAAAAGAGATNWNPANAGRWVDVALSFDGTGTRLFADGQQVAAASNGFAAVRLPELLIGGGHLNVHDAFWRGKIDDVRIYRSALDAFALAAVNDWLGDPDQDGLGNGREWERGTDPNDPDTDGDGLADNDEVAIHGTNPLSPDSDNDLMPDAWEVAHGTNPREDDAAADPDGDHLTNVQEYGYGTWPLQADPDADGLEDDEEIARGTDPFDADSDADGLSDGAEVWTHATNPLSADTDGDGLPDKWEVDFGLDATVANAGADPDGDGLTNLQEYGQRTLPLDPDTDGDGLEDGPEIVHGADPRVPDTDADGLPDGWEVDYGFDPASDGGIAYGLAARWAFEEGVGAVSTNRAATHWPAQLKNMTETNWTAGRGIGMALGFDGATSYAGVDQTAAAVITGAPFTVTAVIWQEPGWTGSYPTVVSDGALFMGDRWPGFALRYAAGLNALAGYAGNSNAPVSAVLATNWSPEMAGRWVDVALAHDGTQARLFVDGREVAAAPQPFAAAFQPELRIGGGHVNVPDAYWRGRIDDVRLYRSALGTNALALVNDWLGDADGDGASNGAEYLAETDPRGP